MKKTTDSQKLKAARLTIRLLKKDLEMAISNKHRVKDLLEDSDEKLEIALDDVKRKTDELWDMIGQRDEEASKVGTLEESIVNLACNLKGYD